MSTETDIHTVQILVRDESFELSPSLFARLVQHSPDVQLTAALSFDVDPCIFNAYLLYIQSDCFIRPPCLFQEDFIDGLRICGAPAALIEHCKLTSSRDPTTTTSRSEQIFVDVLILTSLIISACVLTIDLYRQMLIFNEHSPKALVLLVYLIDGALFLYSSGHAISKFIADARSGKRWHEDLNLLADLLSSLGVLCYLTTQRSSTSARSAQWNFVWIVVHLCRTARLIQLGFHLIGIRWCLCAIWQCLEICVQTLLGLFWIFTVSGSILYLIDMIEKNEQYSSVYSTILSAHETLYTIGYRNNAPYGCWTRAWTMISVYFLSSLVQTLCWWFQTNVTLKWRKLFSSA